MGSAAGPGVTGLFLLVCILSPAILAWRSRVESNPNVCERLDRLDFQPMPSLAGGTYRSRSIRAWRAGSGPGWVRCEP